MVDMPGSVGSNDVDAKDCNGNVDDNEIEGINDDP